MRYFYYLGALLCMLTAPPAEARNYHLDIARKDVNITGVPTRKITVNGTIPGPTLRFTEGEEATITVTNHMDEDTSVHWHGLLLDGSMDGVPGLNGFPGIKPGETFTYKFRIRQSGTYWYHAHSVGQEQDGHYGSMVITPKGGEPIHADRDYVLLLSDFSEEDSQDILSNLKMDSAYYNYGQRTVSDFFADAKERGFDSAWRDAAEWGTMRMSPTDLADVSGYTFLINGKTPDDRWLGLFTPGEKVRLRIINASSMSFFDFRIPGLKLKVVGADGQPVEPVTVDEFRIAPAETYDIIVTPKDAAYTIAAEPIDRTGFALGTLAPREGMQGETPQQRKRTQLTMVDMNMEAMMKDYPDMDMSHMHGMTSGWADVGTPEGHRALNYKDLRYAGIQRDTRKPSKEITLRLGGSMERYIWTINGKTYSDAAPIPVRYGERVKLTFVNETMMAHPMHLHGMFVQPLNGQPAAKLPNKHTVFIPPGQSYSVLLTADESGEWAFHCHLLYHMLSGMMTHLVVDKRVVTAPEPDTQPAAMEQHHHAH